MEPAVVDLRWPMGGVFRRTAYQDSPPKFSIDSLNVRPDDVIQGRERGGSRPGLGKVYSQQLGSGNPIRLLTDIVYDSSGRVTRLVASSNGTLYRDVSGTMTAVSSGTTLASDVSLGSASTLQKLYICGDNTANRQLCVYDPSANTLGVASPTAGTIPTKCKLACVAADRLWLAGDDQTGVWYASRAGDPLDFDYSEDDAQAATSATNARAGSISGEDITALITHTDDCVIFGSVSGIWSMRGNPATSGSLVRLSDRTGVHGADSWAHDAEGYLWLWTQDGLYVMSPGCGSMPMSVSRELLPEELVNLDRDKYTVTLEYDYKARGLHLFVSREPAGTTRHYWIDIKMIASGDGKSKPGASFWPMSYEDDYEPFSTHSYRDPGNSLSPVYLGCRDGYIRRFVPTLKQDDGTDFDSWVFLGPFFPGEHAIRDGILTHLIGELARGSGKVNWEVYAGESVEDAVYTTEIDANEDANKREASIMLALPFRQSQPLPGTTGAAARYHAIYQYPSSFSGSAAAASYSSNGQWEAGVNTTDYPRVRASSFFLKLERATSNTAWALEKITAVMRARGRRRV